MQFGVLGNLEVLDDDGNPVELGGTQPRTALAMLLAASGRIVPVDVLFRGIWGDRIPDSAAGTLQSYVSRLRRELEPGRARGRDARVLVWEPPGYRLVVEPDAVDFRRFERLLDDGTARLAEGDAAGARERLVEASSLWRGDALVEFADHEFARGLATRLEQQRLTCIEQRLEADLMLGRHAAVVGELTELVGEHPLREGFWALLARALYRSGRQSEALRVLDDMRQTLLEELGVDPSPPLRELETQILNHDPALDPIAVPAPLAPTGAQWGEPAGGSAAPASRSPDGSGSSGLVGRAGELGQLGAVLDEALGGRPRFAVIEGEPGIGKTRLLEELGAVALDRGAEVVWGRCHEGGSTPAFWPWLEVLRATVDRLPPEIVADEQGLGRLVGSGGADTTIAEVLAANRFDLFEAVGRAFSRVTAEVPFVVVIDDLQWADLASLELLEFLANSLADARVLVAASVRELEVGRNDAVVSALAAMTRRPGTRRMHLRGMNETETAVLVERAIGTAPASAVTRAIHARSDGNPFFVGELARLVASEDTGSVDEMVQRATVPAGVRDVVGRRLSQLTGPTVDLLQAAAVVGRDVELAVLARTADLDLAGCLEALEPAITGRLIAEVGAVPGMFRFSHALVREVVLSEVGTLRRAQLHLRAAQAITDVGGDTDDNAEIVADHLRAAVPLGEPRTAALAMERAADVATRRFAYESAEDLLGQAVELRRAAGSGPDDLEAELLAISRLVMVRRMRRGYTASIDDLTLDRARELAERVDRLDVLNHLLWTEWAGAATACDLVVAERLGRRLLDLAIESSDPLIKAAGHANWGIQCWHLGRITEAADYLDRAIEITGEDVEYSRPIFAVASAQHEPIMLGIGFRLIMHELIGDITDGEERLRAYAESQTDPYGECVCWGFEGFAGVVIGDPVRAARAGRRALAAERAGEFPFFGGAAGMYLATALTEFEEYDEALALFAEHEPRYRGTGVRTILPMHLTNHGLAFLRSGRVDEAAARMDDAAAVLDATGELWTEPFVLLGRAELDQVRGADSEQVAATIGRAIEIATRQGSHRRGRTGRRPGRHPGRGRAAAHAGRTGPVVRPAVRPRG